MTEFVVVVGGEFPLLFHDLKSLADGFEKAKAKVMASDDYEAGTTVEAWVAEYWDEDVGFPLEAWLKEAE